MFMSEVRKWQNFILGSLEGEFLQEPGFPSFVYLDSTVYPNFTLALFYRRLLVVAMGASLLFIIYATLFHNYILLFLPVGAEFQQIEDAIASSIPVSTRSTSTVVPTAQPKPNFDLSIAQDIETMQVRRINSIIGNLKSPSSIPSWLSTLGPDGKWPDNEVDYTTGCAARRANWPAQAHWQRILIMAGAWYGYLKGAGDLVRNQALRTAISKAMDYWFGRDFTDLACLDQGGTDQCPCSDDTHFWNKNWFSNLLLIPKLVAQTCLLLNNTLSSAQLDKCNQMTGRSIDASDKDINGLGYFSGANLLDLMQIAIDSALLKNNASLLTVAFQQAHSELQIKNGAEADGIKGDGSFGQHMGILYNGNYGKDFGNDVLDMEILAGGTTFAAGSDSRNAFTTLMDGNRWMIFRNTLTGALHWDFSVLGRFISFPVIDAQATGGIKINLANVLTLAKMWSSDILLSFARLSEMTTSANAGNLTGHRGFPDADYVVNRGSNYVTSLKMYSNRTKNSECTNSQNPNGFHLSDGVLYTYVQGNEYEDIAAAWDWNLIPGITVDYGATALICPTTKLYGIEAFVGVVSNGEIGIAVMRYTNPVTGSLHWQKAWFFLDGDVQHTMISGLTSTTSAPVYSVLDQRHHAGSVMVDGVSTNSIEDAQVQTLWHGDVGHLFPDFNNSAVISVSVTKKSGSWSAIGISSQPPTTVELFTARIEHKSISTPVSYTTFPGTSYETFVKKSAGLHLQSVQNDKSISAVFNGGSNTAMVVFWDAAGGSVTFDPGPANAPITITADGNIALLYRLETGEVTVSDPSQSLVRTQVTLTLGQGTKPPKWGNGLVETLNFNHPSGGGAGGSVGQTVG